MFAAIHQAAIAGQVDCLTVLLKHDRVNVALTGLDGMTALHCAVTYVNRTSDSRSEEEFDALRVAGLRLLLSDPRFDVNARVRIPVEQWAVNLE